VEIQPIVIGTAGHIDHGKSSLVRALTGIDPDRLKEEKERGLTIDLGFARLDLPDGRRVGLIDVPGHERFVRNMVAGATGIDMVVLVVAADDGVMPQTREHLAIMQLLGVSRGFLALNKIDLVDEDMALLAEEDAREMVRGTFLEGAPIVRVSATTGEGLEELRAVLVRMAMETEPRSSDGLFRMPIQRVFSARGFGTIVTGIPVSGAVEIGDVLEIQPGGSRGKVRSIQAYHESAPRARAGHSTALNLADVDHHEVERGHVVAAPGYFTPQSMLAAHLTTLADLDRPIRNRMHVRLHTGTAEAVGEVVLLDQPELGPASEGLVQIRLERPMVCAPGDRFILRLASPAITLGGGLVLDESRYRLKRFKDYVLDDLSAKRAHLGSPREFLEAHLRTSKEPWVALDTLAVHVKRQKSETRELLDELRAAGRALAPGPTERWIHVERLEAAVAEILRALDEWFAEHPLRGLADVRDLRAKTGFDAAFVGMLCDVAASRGEIELAPAGQLRRLGRAIAVDARTAELGAACRERVRAGGFQPPTPQELCTALAIEVPELSAVLAMLVDQGALVRVAPDLYLTPERVEEARVEVVANCGRHGQLEIPELRDRLGTSRKFLIPLLEYFDAQGVTIRQAGHRVLKRR
jgi:selenocysteine-specific elongation factor